MQSPIILIAVFGVISVQADLTCLGWGLISPIVGLFCHFEPEYFQKAENDSVAAVEDAIQSTENLVQFDLTHNPAAVAYDFYKETNTGGLSQGSQYLQNVTKDFSDVTIGFGKTTANQLITVMELSYWNDISMCLITGAAGLVSRDKRRRLGKRAVVPSTEQAVSMAQDCYSQRFQQLASPAVFHVNGTNQKIGSTISNLAGLLAPIGAEEKAVANAAQAIDGAVDLAIPGSESTTRVLKKVGENTADHFANEEEATAVAENMKDKNWLDENCGICGVSPPPLADVIAKRKRQDTNSLNSRGIIAATCCSTTKLNPDKDAASSLAEDAVSEERKGLIHNPLLYTKITEADLKTPPTLSMRDVMSTDDVKALHSDLDSHSTGLISWSPRLTDVMTSDQLLSTLRKTFTGPPEDSLYQLLQIRERDGGLRLFSYSNKWIKLKNPALQRMTNFVNGAIAEGIHAVARLKGLSAYDTAFLDGEMEFFYTPPNQKALAGTDPRGFHIDGGIMQFGIADVPGLVVVQTATGTASRVPVEKNAFHLLKARFWDIQAWYQQTPEGPTWHSVFGPEMAKEGRVSIIMTIFRQKIKHV